MCKLLRYKQSDGKEPFTEWLLAMRDKLAQARVRVRLRSLEAGNFVDCDAVGEGVLELRVHMGPGYRVCFGRHGNAVVVLLSGGDKSS